MTRLNIAYLATPLALTLATGAACENKGPSPKTATPAPQAAAPEPGGTPKAEGDVMDVGTLTFTRPAKWESQPVSSSMRRAQLSVPGSAGPGELVVYFFGSQGAGSAQANIDRWVGQFRADDGKPIAGVLPEENEVAGLKSTQVEVAGRYVSGMGPAGPQQVDKPGQRMIATIVETSGGPYYFKFLGPDATITENRDAYDTMLASMKED